MSCMSLEQDRLAAWADFGFYGLAVLALAAVAVFELPAHHAWQAAGWVLAGVVGWTLAEYALHRFVLHGVQPFKRWHGLHHERPQAYIATPTLLTAGLFAGLILAPAWWLLPAWLASALVLGVLVGYLAYILMHHAAHHGHGASAALRRHKRWHALHHRAGSQACYGVSLPLWDHVFRSARPQVRQRTDGAAAQP